MTYINWLINQQQDNMEKELEQLKALLKEVNEKMANNQEYQNSGLYLKVLIALN